MIFQIDYEAATDATTLLTSWTQIASWIGLSFSALVWLARWLQTLQKMPHFLLIHSLVFLNTMGYCFIADRLSDAAKSQTFNLFAQG